MHRNRTLSCEESRAILNGDHGGLTASPPPTSQLVGNKLCDTLALGRVQHHTRVDAQAIISPCSLSHCRDASKAWAKGPRTALTKTATLAERDRLEAPHKPC
ncbi:hypothetical protein COCCADRAFT_21831 [Bipolaris zeicola 26-R-13]|uniref:Uncharacterized protein n=1 Tax=Cochliobolus carbonum (strain 26-R-13) TaxID=930089 RepID=W6YTQ3_COCC2|nr:uncharacterized protein COCCADRAFT_21831 [Bipolaris zeicola 26-R-13]EUC38789.1 hypothetical protein COCCADRAFT_21831 [Bipolaris zeicola 26-R-13]